MISILKRIKIEVNDERLSLAVACSDGVSDLVVFKDQSEPTWLFIGGGKPVRLFRGSNAPKLAALIKLEFENELQCMEGRVKRTLISIHYEMSRRKRAEAEAQRLACLIKDEGSREKEGYSDRLMEALVPYTVLVIQNFLLETGAVTEIRDFLVGEFRVEQERYVNLNDGGIRQLFHIPDQVPDPSSETVGENNIVEKEENEYGEMELGPIPDSSEPHVLEVDTVEDIPKSRRDSSSLGAETHESTIEALSVEVKMLNVKLPDGLVGDTLVMLLESVEVRKNMGQSTCIQSADEHIQLKVGPIDHAEAVSKAPTSLHAVYGKGKYLAGIWCPRTYHDKRYVMINFFPRFVTEMLMPPPGDDPKYVVAVYSADKASAVSVELELYSGDVMAEGTVALSAEATENIFRSQDPAAEKYNTIRGTLQGKRVYAVCVAQRSSELLFTLISTLDPIHFRLDQTYEEIESMRMFEKLKDRLSDRLQRGDIKGQKDEKSEKDSND